MINKKKKNPLEILVGNVFTYCLIFFQRLKFKYRGAVDWWNRIETLQQFLHDHLLYDNYDTYDSYMTTMRIFII